MVLEVTLDADKFASAVSLKMSAIRKSAERGLFKFAEAVMTLSKTEYVPVLTGALRASGHVDTPKWSGNVLSIVMGFGSSAVHYALSVHENLAMSHTVGSAKYLEIPLMKMTPLFGDFIAAEIKAGLGQ